jgi:hypothetical protein
MLVFMNFYLYIIYISSYDDDDDESLRRTFYIKYSKALLQGNSEKHLGDEYTLFKYHHYVFIHLSIHSFIHSFIICFIGQTDWFL